MRFLMRGHWARHIACAVTGSAASLCWGRARADEAIEIPTQGSGTVSAVHDEIYRTPHPINPENSVVFVEFSIDDAVVGTVEIELFDDTVPRTATNFACLCTGYYRGYPITVQDMMARSSVLDDRRLNCYRNTLIHVIKPGFHAHGGDTTRYNGRGGESIYSGRFVDERKSGKSASFASPGVVAMATASKHANKSQFFVTYRPCPWLSKRQVAFGQVIKGWSVMKRIEKEGTAHGKPRREVSISHCGIVKLKSGSLRDAKDPAGGEPKVEWTGRGSSKLSQKARPAMPWILEQDWVYGQESGMSDPRYFDYRGGEGTGPTVMPDLSDLLDDPTNVGCS